MDDQVICSLRKMDEINLTESGFRDTMELEVSQNQAISKDMICVVRSSGSSEEGSLETADGGKEVEEDGE
jgi:hypothetical protein